MGFFDTGGPIFLVNWLSGTFYQALKAGVLQGFLTFTVVGFNVAFYEYLYGRRTHRIISILLPTTIYAILGFCVHTYFQSPEPLWSAFVLFCFGLWFYTLLSVFKTKAKTISPIELSKMGIRKIKKKFF